jgi:uncharacterized protein YndB with AHSA1/START domain
VPQRVDERAHSSAPREAVWELVADPVKWAEWGPWSRVELLREGTPPPGGVHALKRMRSFPTTVTEEVTLVEPPARLVYEMRAGLPLRGYSGEITLSEASGGTDIRWRTSFEPKLPGTGGLFQRILSGFTKRAADRLARAAEGR